ncbi:hypothetical protein ASPZODRAFT_26446 [Penicilliopsis zonata CBS 506.65]|uniref:Uncharacterized protein n=1 Tax=Penicilliopsis zonata CBS 506.65 TaxID=1073090 RepID=A0A1L9SFI3_9EURO|nr:hypothetical protein ASPZODRAFT_26446 [Penicilliopsis zonata CBS 506.65]OJJ45837.1 hypothetical protein ASPZODRAFT_26446 [Penicilliopsis zonata CBS 506.65]
MGLSALFYNLTTGLEADIKRLDSRKNDFQFSSKPSSHPISVALSTLSIFLTILLFSYYPSSHFRTPQHTTIMRSFAFLAVLAATAAAQSSTATTASQSLAISQTSVELMFTDPSEWIGTEVGSDGTETTYMYNLNPSATDMVVETQIEVIKDPSGFVIIESGLATVSCVDSGSEADCVAVVPSVTTMYVEVPTADFDFPSVAAVAASATDSTVTGATTLATSTTKSGTASASATHTGGATMGHTVAMGGVVAAVLGLALGL